MWWISETENRAMVIIERIGPLWHAEDLHGGNKFLVLTFRISFLLF